MLDAAVLISAIINGFFVLAMLFINATDSEERNVRRLAVAIFAFQLFVSVAVLVQ